MRLGPSRFGALICAAILVIQTGARASETLGRTFFQTNEPFDPRIALNVDSVVVHRHGNPDIASTLESWRSRGYPVGRMFFIGSDAGRLYTKSGETDRTAEAETGRRGEVFECAGVRPYMVPTPGWREYVRGLVRESIEAGASAILPEEPLAHTRSGYGEAFKKIWEERFQTPWRPPHHSPDLFYKANKLKSDLYFELVRDALRETEERASEQGEEIPFILPIHSLLSHAAGQMLYPSGRTLKLAAEGLDGFVGQVWTGPIAWSMSKSAGRKMTRDEDFFASAYLLYSYLANLVHGTDLSCYLLADPVEDDPQFSWEDYRRWYHQSLTAMLLFPWMNQFEVMPWPDRVFLPGYDMASGTPAPEEYRRNLACIFAALSETATFGGKEIQTLGDPLIGFLVADTLCWQRGGPEGSRMEAVHGITLPLLKKGIPVQIVPLERHGDRAFLDRFQILILSYDAMKPLEAAMNQDLADWVKRGGTLVFLGGADLYNSVDEWWRREGYDSPVDHLFEKLGVWRRGDERFIFQGPQETRSLATRFNLNDLDTIVLPRGWRLADYHFPDANQLYRLLGERGTPRCGVISQIEAANGNLVYCGLPAAWFAEEEKGGRLAHQIILHAGEIGGHSFRNQPRAFEAERGPFVIVRTMDHERQLKGTFIDLLDPNLAWRSDPTLPAGSSAVFKRCPPAETGNSTPGILFMGPSPEKTMETEERLSAQVKSPEETPVTARIACRGKRPSQISLSDLEGNALDREIREAYDPRSDSLLLIFQAGFEGAVLSVDWKETTQSGKSAPKSEQEG